MFRIIFFIFLLLLIITFLLLFIPIDVIICYSESFSIYFKIFGIKFKLPLNKSSNKKSVTKPKKTSTTKFQNKNSFKFFIDIFKIGGNTLVCLLKNLNIKDLTLRVKVSSSDAASTAVLYGKLSAIIYPFCGIIISKAKPKNYDINIYPDFLAEKICVYFNFHCSGKIFEIIKSLLCFIREYNKIKTV